MRTAIATALALLAAGCASAPPRQPPPPLAPPGAPEIRAVRVADPPMVDGVANDAAWADAPELEVRLPDVCRIRAVVHGETLYVLLSWKDSTEDSEMSDMYIGPAIPWGYLDTGDLIDLALPIEGPFPGDPLAPVASTMDRWRWDAMRDKSGHARDGWMKIEMYEPARGEPGGVEVLDDQGAVANGRTPPSGSAADVLGRGRWRDGQWTVELARALRTGHPDDRDLADIEECPMTIRVLDKSTKGEGSPGRIAAPPVLRLLLPPPLPEDRQGPFPEPRGGSGYGR